MASRIFSRAEVDRMLPLIRVIAEEARWAARELSRIVTPEGASERVVLTLDELPQTALERMHDLRRCERELDLLGAVLRDPLTGTVEWYGEAGGAVVFYSWKPGEATVSFYRDVHGLIAERMVLPERVTAEA